MTFEKQICSKCNKIRFCVYIASLDQQDKISKSKDWFCDPCLVESLMIQKDKVSEIMIECGIEDLESN